MTTAFVPTPWRSPRAYWAQRVDGPNEEPLTVAEGKLRAGLDWLDGDPRDALMEDFIRAARQQVEQDTGLALLTQTHEVTLLAGATQVLVPQTQPAQSVEVVAPAPAVRSTVLLPWDYQPGVPQLWTADEACTLRIVAGWPDAATLRLEAPSLYHAVGVLVAHFATLGRDAVLTGTIQSPMGFGYDEAIAAHRLITVI